MSSEPSLPAYRQQSSRKTGQLPKKYRGTYELVDEENGQIAAYCDLIGRAMFAGLDIYDAGNRLWPLRANRKIMPTRWALQNPSGQVIVQFDQKVLGKLTNPLYRVVLALLDSEGHERYRLVDPRSSIPDRIMSIHIGDWPLLEGDRPIARITKLAREPAKPARGLLGKLRNLIQITDRGFVSAGDNHALPAPAVLALLLLFDEVTDTSAAD